MTEMEIPKAIRVLTENIFADNNIKDFKIVDWDLDRVYIESGLTEYTIRTWDITEYVVTWTLFKMVSNADDTVHGETLDEGVFPYKDYVE